MGTHSSETSRHLNRVEEATKVAKELLGRYRYPDDLRTVLVAGFIDQMLEHHGAMLLLIRSGMTGSSFALARGVVDGMYRGLWVNFCANDDELKKFENEDRLPLQMKDMARAIDEKLCAGHFFVDLLDRGWKSLNSYAHTGLLQLGRRFTGHTVVPSYSDEEIDEVTTTVTTCILLLASRFLVAQSHVDEGKKILELIGTYGPASAKTPSGEDR